VREVMPRIAVVVCRAGVALIAAGCGSDDNDGSAAESTVATTDAVDATSTVEVTTPGPVVATIRVVDETYKVELATPELIAHARGLLAGEELPTIPIGKIVRDAPSVNAPWSWHIDPATLEFADMTTEVCDGLPEYVEET